MTASAANVNALTVKIFLSDMALADEDLARLRHAVGNGNDRNGDQRGHQVRFGHGSSR